jgi:hypothetical protein
MTVGIRGQAFAAATGSVHTINRCAQKSGDTVLVLMAGGNQSTSFNDYYGRIDDKDGQEAQGSALADIAEAGENAEVLTVNWDGADPHAILMVAVEKGCEFDFRSDRVGSVGASLAEDHMGFILEGREGDKQVALAFARNSTTLPTSDLGEPTFSQVVGGSAMAAWIVDPGNRAETNFVLPAGRSGHYVAVANFWENPALLDTSTDAPGDVWAMLENVYSPTTPADGSGEARYFDTVTYVDGVAGGDPEVAGYNRLMVEMVTDNPGTTAVRWILDVLHPSGGYSAYSNDQGFGQTFTGQRARRQAFAPYYVGYNASTGGYDFPLREILADVGLGSTRSWIQFDETSDPDGVPVTYGAHVTRLRLYIYKPHRQPLPPPPPLEQVALAAHHGSKVIKATVSSADPVDTYTQHRYTLQPQNGSTTGGLNNGATITWGTDTEVVFPLHDASPMTDPSVDFEVVGDFTGLEVVQVLVQVECVSGSGEIDWTLSADDDGSPTYVNYSAENGIAVAYTGSYDDDGGADAGTVVSTGGGYVPITAGQHITFNITAAYRSYGSIDVTELVRRASISSGYQHVYGNFRMESGGPMTIKFRLIAVSHETVPGESTPVRVRPLGPDDDTHRGVFAIPQRRSISCWGQVATDDNTKGLWVQPTARFLKRSADGLADVDRVALGAPILLGSAAAADTSGDVVLAPTEVPFSIGASPSVNSSTVTTVGTVPVLSDDNDATYYEFTGTNGFSVMLPVLDLPEGATVTGIEWNVRASAGSTAARLDYTIEGYGDDAIIYSPFSIEPNLPANNNFYVNGGTTPTNYSGIISDLNYQDFYYSINGGSPGPISQEIMAQQLAMPSQTFIGFRGLVGSGDPTVTYRIYSASLVVHYTLPGAPAIPAPEANTWAQYLRYADDLPTEPTHWSLELVATKNDPRVDNVTRPDGGTVLYADCAYVPDNGLDLSGQPYLDGDQPYGIWEGDPRRSTSIFGAKPITVVLGDGLVTGTHPPESNESIVFGDLRPQGAVYRQPVGAKPTEWTEPWVQYSGSPPELGDASDSSSAEIAYRDPPGTSVGINVPMAQSIPVPEGYRVASVVCQMRGQHLEGDLALANVWLRAWEEGVFDSVCWMSYDDEAYQPSPGNWTQPLPSALGTITSPSIKCYRSRYWEDPAWATSQGEDPSTFTPETHPGTLLADHMRTGQWSAEVWLSVPPGYVPSTPLSRALIADLSFTITCVPQ